MNAVNERELTKKSKLFSQLLIKRKEPYFFDI